MTTSSANLLDSFRRDRARGTNDDVDLTLRPAYSDLLAKLGNPQTKLPPVFHVAGTNGKGSTCAFLRAILEAAGCRVHVYTSPHLLRFHERIRIRGRLIEEAELAELLQKCQNLSESGDVTYFEAATAVALAAFARHPADFTIMEVGLGGRLDATNIIPNKLATIITRLSYDHRDYLGDSLTKIAGEKAGIMREGVPCFAAAQPDADVLSTLHSHADKIRAPFFVANKDWQITKTKNGFSYQDKKHSFDLPKPALLGEHQYDNAGLAIAALMGIQDSALGIQISENIIADGLKNVEWPARLQHLQSGQLASLLPHNSELWLDGGHNDSAGEVLAKQAKEWTTTDQRPLHLICGMLTTKKPAEFLQPLQAYISGLHCVTIPGEAASFTRDDLAAIARGMNIKNVHAHPTVKEAIQNLIEHEKRPMRILVCGSLYLAGHVLAENNQKI